MLATNLDKIERVTSEKEAPATEPQSHLKPLDRESEAKSAADIVLHDLRHSPNYFANILAKDPPSATYESIAGDDAPYILFIRRFIAFLKLCNTNEVDPVLQLIGKHNETVWARLAVAKDGRRGAVLTVSIV